MPSSLSFFSSRYAHHQHLHSFPTRRSSDLDAPRIRDDGEIPHDAELLEAMLEIAGEVRNDAQVIGAVQQLEHCLEELGVDRKSTRLNSSHITISYAVFCLKKNKKTNKDNLI